MSYAEEEIKEIRTDLDQLLLAAKDKLTGPEFKKFTMELAQSNAFQGSE